MTVPRSTVAAVCVVALLAACGGASDDTSDDAASDAAPTSDGADTESPDPSPTSDSDATNTTADESDSGSIDDYDPGDIEFRVVNVLDDPVDIYTRTTGLVQTYLIEDSVQPGAVTELVAPPVDGAFVVTEAGAGDASCVTQCDHFITELNTFPDEGPIRTVILYDDEYDGPRAFDLWEHPEPGKQGHANAMVPADSDAGAVVVTGIALTDADFGLRLGFAGPSGCAVASNAENVLVGGNQTPAYLYDGESTDVLMFDQPDKECAETPVGGPFTIEGGAGTRTHLILSGSPGDLDAAIVPMVDR